MAVNATAARHGNESATAVAAAPSPPPPLALRIVDIQHAQAKPLAGLDPCFSPLTGEALELVPVIRIYGATPAGQKACLHLHGVRRRCCAHQAAFWHTSSCCSSCCDSLEWSTRCRPTWTATGTAARIAVAQVLPYFYIPYDDDLPLDQDGARAWLRDLARGIDLAMQIGASVGT